MLAVTKTHTGLIRTTNEDAVLMLEPRLYAVADGMGGHAAGEIASSEALRVLKSEAFKFEDLRGEELICALKETAEKANRHLRTMVKRDSELNGMGTTLAAVYMALDGKAYILNIGDSRVYLRREGKLELLTRDHSMVAELIAKGELSEKDALAHPKRHVILKAIGAEDDIEPDVFETDIKIHDRLLICSDGLSDMVDSEELNEILKNEKIEIAADMLIEAALNNGGRDNITFVLLEIDREEDIYID